MSSIDQQIATILTRTKTVALVGFSANPRRPSHDVAQFLHNTGMRIIPVNPGLAGQFFFGEEVYRDLGEIPFDIDMVDIFRRSEHVPAIVDGALNRWPDLPTIWMQIGVSHAAAAKKARLRGADVIEDRCPKIEFMRLLRS